MLEETVQVRREMLRVIYDYFIRREAEGVVLPGDIRWMMDELRGVLNT